MFSESAHLYDAIYQSFKDYPAESREIAALIRRALPAARTVLDVACGTAEHARILRAEHGFVVDGLDLDPKLLAVARAKVPAARFFEADMSAFSLGSRYDVVMCMFSSIGYLTTLDRVTAALRAFRAHLEPGGIVIVEPWFTPGVLKPGHVTVVEADAGDTHVVRTSGITVDGALSHLTFDYAITDASGTRTAREEHTLGIYTPEQLLGAFREAGLAATHDPAGIAGRGMYVARASA